MREVVEHLRAKVVAEKCPLPVPGAKGSGLHGFKCVLLSSCSCPDVAWAEQHEDERLKSYVRAEWWRVVILGGEMHGGYFTYVPEALLRFVRTPTYEDLMSLVEYANADGRRALAAAFPELVGAAKEKLIKGLLEQGANES